MTPFWKKSANFCISETINRLVFKLFLHQFRYIEKLQKCKERYYRVIQNQENAIFSKFANLEKMASPNKFAQKSKTIWLQMLRFTKGRAYHVLPCGKHVTVEKALINKIKVSNESWKSVLWIDSRIILEISLNKQAVKTYLLHVFVARFIISSVSVCCLLPCQLKFLEAFRAWNLMRIIPRWKWIGEIFAIQCFCKRSKVYLR